MTERRARSKNVELGQFCLRSARQRGLTLIEVLIVVALIGMLGGTIAFGSGMFSSTRMRAAATLLVSAVRLGLTQATANGKPTRLVLDLDARRIILEEASSSAFARETGKDTTAGAEAATEAEQKARAEADRIMEGPRAPRARFRALKQFSEEGSEVGRALGANVEIIAVQTEHDDEPRTSGRAYIYMWPGGITERASIQLRVKGSEGGLTVLIDALTGRARIEKGRIDLPPPPENTDNQPGKLQL